MRTSLSSDNGEEPFKDITVELVGAAGSVVANTKTDADGTTSSLASTPGTYTVKVTKAAKPS